MNYTIEFLVIKGAKSKTKIIKFIKEIETSVNFEFLDNF
jgi:hypothetical protein